MHIPRRVMNFRNQNLHFKTRRGSTRKIGQWYVKSVSPTFISLFLGKKQPQMKLAVDINDDIVSVDVWVLREFNLI